MDAEEWGAGFYAALTVGVAAAVIGALAGAHFGARWGAARAFRSALKHDRLREERDTIDWLLGLDLERFRRQASKFEGQVKEGVPRASGRAAQSWKALSELVDQELRLIWRVRRFRVETPEVRDAVDAVLGGFRQAKVERRRGSAKSVSDEPGVTFAEALQALAAPIAELRRACEEARQAANHR